MLAPYRGGERAHLGERREVGGIERTRRVAGLAHRREHVLAALPVAAVDQHAGAGRRKRERDDAADAVGRAGDQDGLAGELHGQLGSNLPQIGERADTREPAAV